MRFWIRELAGWLLVGLGLLVFYACYELLLGGRYAETGTLTIIGIFLFRGGIHLLKMAVAARVCLQAQERMAQEQAGKNAAATPGRPAVRFPQVARGLTNRGTRTSAAGQE
jgi:hypothetical protein